MPSEFTPEGLDRLLALLPRLARREVGAIEHRDARVRHVHESRLIQEQGHAHEVFDRASPRGEVVNRQHGMRLAAAKGGLQLDHRIAALAVESLGHGGQQQAHSLRDEGALEECRGILILAGGLAGAHRGDVGRELGLLERAFEHVGMGMCDFAPRLHVIKGSERNRERPAKCGRPRLSDIFAAGSLAFRAGWVRASWLEATG